MGCIKKKQKVVNPHGQMCPALSDYSIIIPLVTLYDTTRSLDEADTFAAF